MNAPPALVPPSATRSAPTSAEPPRRRARALAFGSSVAVVLAIGVAVATSPWSTESPASAESTGSQGSAGSAGSDGVREPTADDGRVAEGEVVSPFDDEVPTVAGLDADLLAALREAARAVEEDGRPLYVNSGWRSADYQAWLLREAVDQYGSLEAASRWVASPETSAHVTGDAVDVGPYATAEWLSRRGAQFGLCQVYANEIWHFELRPDAPVEGCPEMLADSSEG